MGAFKTPAGWVLPVLACAVMLAAVAALRNANSPLEAKPPLEIALPPAGANSQETHVPRRELLLRLDLAGLPLFPVYSAQLDDVLGVQVLQTGVSASNETAIFRVPRLPPGRYFVRLTAPSGELLREYAIRVE